MPQPDTRSKLSLSAVLTSVAVAVGVNLALLLAGEAAGASFAVPDRSQEGSTMDVGAGAVLLSTVLPLAVGLAVTVLVARRWPRRVLVLQALAVVITLASLGFPLSTDTDTGTRLLLAAMHLVVGGAYLAAVGAQRPHPALGRHAPDPERAM